jgi:peptide/nickel transport system permease protein
MGTIIARRIAFMVFVLWGVTLVTFFLSRVVPGDPARLMAGPEASQSAVAHIRRIYGLDDPIIVQYGRYMRDLLHGNLGFSFVTRRNVRTDIATFLPATIELAGYALVIGFVFALVTGIPAGDGHGRGRSPHGDRRAFPAGVLARAAPATAVPYKAGVAPTGRPS